MAFETFYSLAGSAASAASSSAAAFGAIGAASATGGGRTAPFGPYILLGSTETIRSLRAAGLYKATD
jgi:hypothetical protein